MTDRDDPSRLLDSPEAPAGLREVLKAAQSDVGSDAQLARLATRLGPLLGPAVAAPTGAVAAASASGAAKLGLAAVALILVGGGAWLYSAPGSQPQSAPPPTPISAPAAPAPPHQLAPQAPAVAVPESPASVHAPEETKPAAKPAPPVQLSEAELLEQARRALKSDPARALSRANEHRSRFPGGVLVQEREVIAIQALRQLGRSDEADRRTAAFEKAFPGSAFQRKLKPSP
jgi:hypothetical protein